MELDFDLDFISTIGKIGVVNTLALAPRVIMKPSKPWTETGRFGQLVEVVEFNGLEYRRQPNSVRPGARDYFCVTSDSVQRRLHRDIWEYHNGPIPKGYHIHHKDGNPLNNEIGNLGLESPKEHAEIHGTERSKSPEWIDHLKNIRCLAQAGRKIVLADCVVCGKNFEAVLGRHPKFCSKACKAKDFRNRGMDLKEGVCEICGKAYVYRRHLSQTTCSKKCGFVKQNQTFHKNAETREPVKKTCPVCNTEFEDKSHHNRKVYCSKSCQNFHNRPPKLANIRARFFRNKGIPDPQLQ